MEKEVHNATKAELKCISILVKNSWGSLSFLQSIIGSFAELCVHREAIIRIIQTLLQDHNILKMQIKKYLVYIK